MVEAVSESTPIDQYCPQEEGNDSHKKVTALFKESANNTSSSSRTLKGSITAAIADQELAAKITQVLQERGFFTCDKKLGRGAYGQVLQIEGSDKKKYALKVVPKGFNSVTNTYIRNNSSTWTAWTSTTPVFWSSTGSTSSSSSSSFYLSSSYTTNFSTSSTPFRPFTPPSVDPDHPTISGNWRLSRISKQKGIVGDGLALNFSKTGQLTAAHALLLFNGEKVEYVEKVDVERDDGKAVIGILSDVATGGALYDRVNKLSLDSDTVKGYGKDLAIGLHELHSLGYAHCDLHAGNALIFEDGPFSSARLTDFGLSRKISDRTKRRDWQDLGEIISYMDSSKDPALHSLLHHPTKGLLSPKSIINEEEVINHPYFLKSNVAAASTA